MTSAATSIDEAEVPVASVATASGIRCGYLRALIGECATALDAEALYRELAALSDDDLRARGLTRAGIGVAVLERLYARR